MELIVRNLWRRKTRTFLTALGIAIGVAAVLSLSAFGEGMASGFEQISSSANADLTVSQRDAMMTMLSSVDESVGQELEQVPGVAEVTGAVIGMVSLEEMPYFFALGLEPGGFDIQHYRVIEGSPLGGRRQVLLGRAAADNLNKRVGDTFRLNDFGYRVVGIYETGVAFEDGGAVLSLSDAQRAFDKRNQVSYYSIKLKDLRRMDEVRAAIEKDFPDLVAVRSGEPSSQTEMLDTYRAFGWVLGIFAVLVGGLGMMNTTLMSVFERTREIGVLRALGWRKRRVIGLILGESLGLALLGGVVGLGLGVGLTLLARLSPAVNTLLVGSFKTEMFVQALVTAVLLGLVGGAYPAWRAAQLAPVEAMRAEAGASSSAAGMRFAQYVPGGIALRNLARRPIRTLVSSVGVGVGIGFVVALLAVTAGAREAITQLIGSGEADLAAEQAGVSDMSLSTIDERLADQLKLRPEVRSVSKMVLGFTNSSDLPFFIVYGVDMREEYIAHFRVREGRAIVRSREIMIGRMAAESLEKQLGDRLLIGGTNYTIVGIYENGLSYEDIGGVIDLDEAQRLFRKPRQVSFLLIGLNDPARADEIAQTLERDFPALMISRSAAMTERMQDFKTMDASFIALAIVTVIVGGIVMLNVMMMSVFERTQEIGVLRALGWRKRRILRMILTEALAISLLSALVGVLIGVGVGALLRLAPLYGDFLTTSYTPELLAGTLVLALLLGALGGFYPAWRAMNLRPVEALRYE